MTTYLIQLLFGATLLLLVAVVSNALLYKAAASLRYRVWTFTLLGLLALPILSPMLPTIHLPLHESRERNDALPPLPLGEGRGEGFSYFSHVPNSPHPPYPINMTPSKGMIENVPASATTTIRYDTILFTIWLIGTAVLLFHLFMSIHRVRKMIAPYETVSDPLLDKLRREFGIKRPVRLMLGTTGTVPFITGIFRPTIVLPPQAQNWNESERRAVLTHELAHVARGDLFWQLITQIVCAVYWFHPLVWFAAYRIWVERESACDDTVVLRGEKPSMYADLLLELANGLRKQRIGLLGCTVAIARKNRIGQRIKAILNPNLYRTPLGRFGAAVFLCVAVAAIVLTATISPFAKTDDDEAAKMDVIRKRDEELAKIAIARDAPKLTFKGKVLYPDGTPADRVLVEFQTIALFENPRQPLDIKPTYSTATNGSNKGTDREGNFEFSEIIPAGTTVMFYVRSSNLSPKLVSNPFVFLSETDRDDITLQLQEGIPVNGTATFDDGTPAINRTVMGVRHITPLIGVNELQKSAVNNFHVEYQTPVQADGKFELYLPPGDFQIKNFGAPDDSRSVPIVIIDIEKEYRVDLVLPNPLRGKFIKEGNMEPGNIRTVYLSKSENFTYTHSFTSKPDGEFSLYQRNGSSILGMTEDGLFGIIHPISDDKLNEYQTVVLKPTATVRLQLHDSSGQPLVGQRIGASAGARIQHSSSMASLSTSTTDADGIATFRFPPGTADYQFTWDGGGKMEFSRTFQPGEVVDLEAKTSKEPEV